MSKLITAKFPGTCTACQQPIRPGQTILWSGRGRVAHQNCSRAENEEEDLDLSGSDEDEAAGFEPGTLASDRALARRGLTVVRTNSGWSGTRNSRGRCEDAPCCGCCTF